jgi:hypothetical protein
LTEPIYSNRLIHRRFSSDGSTLERSQTDCEQYVDEINQAGGDATMLHLPAAGVFGNSHMLFQDKNNLQVGDMILSWIAEHVSKDHAQ